MSSFMPNRPTNPCHEYLVDRFLCASMPQSASALHVYALRLGLERFEPCRVRRVCGVCRSLFRLMPPRSSTSGHRVSRAKQNLNEARGGMQFSSMAFAQFAQSRLILTLPKINSRDNVSSCSNTDHRWCCDWPDWTVITAIRPRQIGLSPPLALVLQVDHTAHTE